jgi:plastocyanin
MDKFKTIVAFVLGSVLLLSLSTQLGTTLAQDSASQTFVIQAGTGQGNYRAFAPTAVQVHPGDIVRWITRGCNIHFADAETPFWIPGELEGNPVLNSNPAALVGTIQSGNSYSGGEANSGFPFGPSQPYFELRMDAAPGTYNYYCDTYPGMMGVVEVVDAATNIPAPADVVASGLDEISAALGDLQQAIMRAMDAPAQTTDNGVIITIGLNSGRAQSLEFFPNAVVIQPGQSVTWVVPETIIPELGRLMGTTRRVSL